VAVEAGVACIHMGKAPTEQRVPPLQLLVVADQVAAMAVTKVAALLAAVAAVAAELLDLLEQEQGALFALSGPVTHAHSHQLMWGQHDGTLYSYC